MRSWQQQGRTSLFQFISPPSFCFIIIYPVGKNREVLWCLPASMLATLDTMEPIVDLMLRLQSLDRPIWKSKLWWPQVKSAMESSSTQGVFSLIEKAEKGGKLVPGTLYQRVQLLEGWLIQSSEGKGKEKSYSWVEREDQMSLQLYRHLLVHG